MDEAIEKSAMRKVYMRLLPFAILSYFLASDLIWTALVIGGVLFTSCLMSGW